MNHKAAIKEITNAVLGDNRVVIMVPLDDDEPIMMAKLGNGVNFEDSVEFKEQPGELVLVELLRDAMELRRTVRNTRPPHWDDTRRSDGGA